MRFRQVDAIVTHIGSVHIDTVLPGGLPLYTLLLQTIKL